MNEIKKLVEFLVYSNIYVSICVVALCQGTSLIMGVDSTHLLPFVFFSTLFTYNFQRFVRFSSSLRQSPHLIWIRKNHTVLISILIVSFLLSIYFVFTLSYSALYLLIPASLLSLFYPLRLFSFRKKNISLRELPRLKIFLIALVWSLVSVGLVAIENGSVFSFEFLLLFLARFSFVLAITIPFDIRDLKYDDESIQTIPQIYGEKQAKRIALFALAVFELLSIVHFFIGNFSFSILLALLLSSAFAAILIFKTSQEKSPLFFSFGVEGASILMLVLLFVIPLAFGIFVP